MAMFRRKERPIRPGTRVYVIEDLEYGGPFRGTFTGRVQESKPAVGLTPKAAEKSKFHYLVAFDAPQLDADGDGPYVASWVLAAYVIPA